jgi:hypothetical protein
MSPNGAFSDKYIQNIEVIGLYGEKCARYGHLKVIILKAFQRENRPALLAELFEIATERKRIK